MYIKWTCKKIIAAFLKGLPEYKRRTFSFLEHLFFNLQIFMFLHYANEESDDVIGGSTKTVLHSIKNISGNIGAVFFKLGTRNVRHKRNRMTPTMLLPWQHHRLQSLSVKNQISPIAIF